MYTSKKKAVKSSDPNLGQIQQRANPHGMRWYFQVSESLQGGDFVFKNITKKYVCLVRGVLKKMEANIMIFKAFQGSIFVLF